MNLERIPINDFYLILNSKEKKKKPKAQIQNFIYKKQIIMEKIQSKFKSILIIINYQSIIEIKINNNQLFF